MKIAVASGKGGTGKTTVAVNLALAFAKRHSTVLADCDVEEPNARLFFPNEMETVAPTFVPAYAIDTAKCNGCGRCVEVCRFNSIAIVKSRPMFFPEMCHACNGCVLACPTGAISEETRENGVIGRFREGRLTMLEGRLNIGEAMAVSLIEQVRERAVETSADVELYDCPPGTSCPMIAAVKGCDFAILVTEPTPFGLNDLTIAVETVRLLEIPLGIVINRDGIGDDRVERYAENENIEILAKIPDDRRVAEAYSTGVPAFRAFEEFARAFEVLAETVAERAAR